VVLFCFVAEGQARRPPKATTPGARALAFFFPVHSNRIRYHRCFRFRCSNRTTRALCPVLLALSTRPSVCSCRLTSTSFPRFASPCAPLPPRQPQDGVTGTELRSVCTNILHLIATTVPCMQEVRATAEMLSWWLCQRGERMAPCPISSRSQIMMRSVIIWFSAWLQKLWPYLFEFVVPATHTMALPAVCKSLTHLARTKKAASPDSILIDFDLPGRLSLLACLPRNASARAPKGREGTAESWGKGGRPIKCVYSSTRP